MTTNQPVELGRVSEETREKGPNDPDNEVDVEGNLTL
jgi:hypothetical protein